MALQKYMISHIQKYTVKTSQDKTIKFYIPTPKQRFQEGPNACLHLPSKKRLDIHPKFEMIPSTKKKGDKPAPNLPNRDKLHQDFHPELITSIMCHVRIK